MYAIMQATTLDKEVSEADIYGKNSQGSDQTVL
jgi:hypothetical protein